MRIDFNEIASMTFPGMDNGTGTMSARTADPATIMQDPFQDLAYGVIKRAVEDYRSLGNKLNECEDCIEEKRIEEGIIIHDMNLRKWLRTFHLFIKIEKQISSITKNEFHQKHKIPLTFERMYCKILSGDRR